jgi:flagellar hook-associated protein 3 FlgL
MRITDLMQVNELQQNVNTSLTSLNTITNEISTGKSLNSPSDNPAGTAEDLSIREALLGDTQYEGDATQASSLLTAGGSALSSVSTILNQMNSLAVQGANTGAESQDSLNSLAEQVGVAIQQVKQLANTNVAGVYVFGGTNTGSPPYTGNPPTYQGNEGALTATIGPGNTITLNSPGSNQSLFGGTLSALQTLQSDLQSGNTTGLTNDITAIQGRITATSQASAVMGDTSNEVTTQQQNLQQLDTQYQTTQSNLEDTDLATAYVQLQSAQNVYQASLVTVSDAYKYTLAAMLG